MSNLPMVPAAIFSDQGMVKERYRVIIFHSRDMSQWRSARTCILMMSYGPINHSFRYFRYKFLAELFVFWKTGLRPFADTAIVQDRVRWLKDPLPLGVTW